MSVSWIYRLFSLEFGWDSSLCCLLATHRDTVLSSYNAGLRFINSTFSKWCCHVLQLLSTLHLADCNLTPLIGIKAHRIETITSVCQGYYKLGTFWSHFFFYFNNHHRWVSFTIDEKKNNSSFMHMSHRSGLRMTNAQMQSGEWPIC